MENYIVKFKNDLKAEQIERKKRLKQYESELPLLEKIINGNFTLIDELTANEIEEKFITFIMFNSMEKTIENILHIKIGNAENLKIGYEGLKKSCEHFSKFIQLTKQEYVMTQNIINAFDNDQIKEPINDINHLLTKINSTSLTIDEISRIIGMTIYFNSQYAKRNKKHNIKNIDIINKLVEYYNQDGTFKYNEDILTYITLMETLTSKPKNENHLYKRLFKSPEKISIIDLVQLLKNNNIKLANNSHETISKEKNEQKETYTISTKTREALQELRKYYKNGSIIKIPENLEEFYKILQDSDLEEKEQQYIISLINTELANKKNMTILEYLTKDEQAVYERAINLLNSFTYSNGDVYILKQYIEELQTISSMLESESDEDNKNYLLSDVPNIIEELSLICDRYTIEDKESSNRFIFLLNKDGMPYICDDINELDQSYRKPIYSLIQRIDKSNQSQFKKIMIPEQLPYNMYEVNSLRGHVAFVEVDSGIYLIIGANIPRNGYQELTNRLKANISVIRQIENKVKNPNNRNNLLKSNEEYLTLFTEPTPNKRIKIQNTN